MITGVVEQPRLLIIAGPNGTGKTTLTQAGMRHDWFLGCEYVNPDVIAKELGDWNNPKNTLDAANIASEKREECLRSRQSLVFETVFSGVDKVDFVRRAIDAGFFVRLFFIGTYHPGINAARVAKRMLHGGHAVPIEKIISRWSKSISNCAIVARVVDRLYLYDNSVDDRMPQLFVRAQKGTIERWYVNAKGNEPSWAWPIIQELDDYVK